MLDEAAEMLASLIVDGEIRATAEEELTGYTQQVEVANAIEIRLQEIAAEIIESEQSSELRKAVAECIEVVTFEVGMQEYMEEFTEKIVVEETRDLADCEMSKEALAAYADYEIEHAMVASLKELAT